MKIRLNWWDNKKWFWQFFSRPFCSKDAEKMHIKENAEIQFKRGGETWKQN